MKAMLFVILLAGTARADAQHAMDAALGALDWIGDADLGLPATAPRLASAAAACTRDVDAALAAGESPTVTHRVRGARSEWLGSLGEARSRLCAPLAAISARMPALAGQAAGQRACAGVPSSRCPRSSSTRRSRRQRSPR